jgi:hypothetical protein
MKWACLPRAAQALALALALDARPGAAACPDCNGDGSVAINELVTGITIALGNSPLDSCPAFDRNADGAVSIDELVAAIAAALGGCDPTPPPSPSPTATPSPDPAQPPTETAALQAWLGAGAYRGWEAESGPHPSAGPHGGMVRTFLNPALFASLSAGDAQHPAGAAAVKELYFTGETVRGWAVMVKLQADSDRGRGWYWFEDFGSGAPFAGVGLGGCTGCHSAGRDFVRIPFPLQ